MAPLLLLLAVSPLSAPLLQAESDSTSTISLSSLMITPSAGSVVFTDPWTAEAFAQAQNSFGGFDQQFNSNLGSQVQANAMVQFAAGRALADPVNLVLSSGAQVEIPTEPIGFVSASSQGTADIFNSTFMITGMITGGRGPVNVTFDAMLKSMQSLFTDVHGINATSEVVFALLIDGNAVLFRDSPLMIGSNMTTVLPFSGSCRT